MTHTALMRITTHCLSRRRIHRFGFLHRWTSHRYFCPAQQVEIRFAGRRLIRFTDRAGIYTQDECLCGKTRNVRYVGPLR
jgi:hypothetical protein